MTAMYNSTAPGGVLDLRQKPKTTKRYPLVLPTEVFEEIVALAKEHKITVAEVLRRCVALGLVAGEVERQPDSALLIRDANGMREIEVF